MTDSSERTSGYVCEKCGHVQRFHGEFQHQPQPLADLLDQVRAERDEYEREVESLTETARLVIEKRDQLTEALRELVEAVGEETRAVVPYDPATGSAQVARTTNLSDSLTKARSALSNLPSEGDE